MFTKTLLEKGIKIRRIDISPNRYLNAIYNNTIYRLRRLFYPDNSYMFIRTPFFAYLTKRKIARAVKKYDKADYCIFSCFDFVNEFNAVPSVLFSDWTYDILIARHGRRPYSFESKYSEQQRNAINKAQIVISLFPVCAEMMRNTYPDANIHYLGSNVINSLYDKRVDAADIIARKSASNTILFIGGRKYLEGAQMLVRAFEILSRENPSLELHIIGMTRTEAGIADNDKIHCYGYLNKNIPSEREKYYELLIRSKIFVNPTPIWGGYSSTVEAMYFYTPVAVSEYEDFKQEFGKGNIDFGKYIERYTPESLADAIRTVIYSDSYKDMCRNARDSVKEYTWESYIDKLLTLLNTRLCKQNVIY